MFQDLEQRIRERAYHLWVADGCRDGEAERHWLAAERDVLAEFAATAAPAKAAPKSRKRRADDTNPETDARPRRRAAS
jgi:hypothetical protein